MIILTIKGSRRDAARALLARGLSEQSQDELHMVPQGIVTQIKIADVYLHQVVDWVTELTRAPYPVGTVLVFVREQEKE